MEKIQKELDKIYIMIKENVRLVIEGKEGWQQRLNSNDEIVQRQRKVNLRIYDNIIGRRKYCGMRGA